MYFFWCFCLMIFWLNAWMLCSIQMHAGYYNFQMQSQSSLLSAYAECNQLEVLGCKKDWSPVPRKCAVSRVFETLGPDCCQRALLSTRTWLDHTWSSFGWFGIARAPSRSQKEARWQGEDRRSVDVLRYAEHICYGEYRASQHIKNQSFSCSDECC